MWFGVRYMAKNAVKTEYTVSSEKLGSTLRIALVADVHERVQDDIILLLKESKPDLIAVAGDTFERFDNDNHLPCGRAKMNFLHRWFLYAAFSVNYFFIQVIGRKNHPKTENSYKLLTQASKIAPVFMSTGNHEEKFNDKDISVFKENRIVILDNSEASVTINGTPLHIGGLSTYCDEEWLNSFAKGGDFKLLLCHHPEYFDTLIEKKDIDLILSGHNHGGQIRLFGKGLFSAGGGLFPKYSRGLYHDRLIVSAGCSNTAALPRLGNPRELVIINLIPKKN